MEQKTMKFVIPKKRRIDIPPEKVEERPSPEIEIPEGYEITAATSEQKVRLLDEIGTWISSKSLQKSHHSVDDCWKAMIPGNIQMIKNARLEHKYETYKKNHSSGREDLGFRVVYDMNEIEEIAKNGLSVNSDGVVDIGDPSQGVMLYTSPASSYAGRYLYRNVPVKIMVFRAFVYGKQNEVPLTRGSIIPSKKHCCHTLMKTESNSTKLHRFLYDHYLHGTYFYEYLPDMTRVRKHPSMIMPYAVISYSLQENAHSLKGFSKISRRFLNFKKYFACKHTLLINETKIVGNVLLPTSSKVPPTPVFGTEVTPEAVRLKYPIQFPELQALRTTEYYGKLLTSDVIRIKEHGMASYCILRFTARTTAFLNAMRRKKCILVFSKSPWTVFYFPTGEIAADFGFPHQENSFHVVSFRIDSLPHLHSMHIGNQESYIQHWMVPNEYSKNSKSERSSKNGAIGVEDPCNSGRIAVFDPPIGETKKIPGILKTNLHKPRKLSVRWKDALVDIREFEHGTDSPHFDHQPNLSFDEKRKQDASAEKQRQEQIRKEHDDKLKAEKTERESQGTDALFKNAMAGNCQYTKKAEKEVKELLSLPSTPNPTAKAKFPFPSSVSASPNISLGPLNVPPPQLNRPPPPLLLNAPLQASVPPFGIPPPNIFPHFPNASVPSKLPVAHPHNFFVPSIGLPVDPKLSSISGATYIPSNFSKPPPILPGIQMPVLLKQFSPSVNSAASVSMALPIPPIEEIRDEPMDIDIDDSTNQGDSQPASLKEEKNEEEEKPSPKEEENDILKLVFSQAPCNVSKKKDSSSVEPTIGSDVLKSLRDTTSLMKLLEKKKEQAAAFSSSSHDIDLRVAPHGPQPSHFNFSFKPKPPTTNSGNVLNVLREDDDDDYEELHTKQGSSQDVDYRKSRAVPSRQPHNDYSKDRDDRVRDIDERFKNIPLPKISAEEENRKKVNAQLQERLRANGKDIEGKVKNSHDMIMQQAFQAQFSLPSSSSGKSSLANVLFPGLSQVFMNSEKSHAVSNPPPEPEPEQIRSPSPASIESCGDTDDYVPKSFLNQKQKCVIVPTESKSGYDTYHGERPCSTIENRKSEKKSPKKPRDFDSALAIDSDNQAKKTWESLMNKPKHLKRSLDKEEGECGSDEEGNKSIKSSSSSSSSVILLSPPTKHIVTATDAPPEIIQSQRSTDFGAQQQFNYQQRNSQGFMNAQLPFRIGFHQRGRGSGNFYNRGNHYSNNMRPVGIQHRSSTTLGNDWMNELRPVHDRDANNYCITLDPNICSDFMITTKLDALFGELYKMNLKKKPMHPRIHTTIYIHRSVYEGMRTSKNRYQSKLFEIIENFVQTQPNLIEVLPYHICDGKVEGSELKRCLARIGKHIGANKTVFLSHSGQYMTDQDIEVLTMREFVQQLESITRDPINI